MRHLFHQVEYCARLRCPSLGKAFAKFGGKKNSRKESDPIQCELVDINVEAPPQENQPMITQPIKQQQQQQQQQQQHHHDNHVEDDVEEIERPMVNLNNCENKNKDTAV
jgi:hypothetical protein